MTSPWQDSPLEILAEYEDERREWEESVIYAGDEESSPAETEERE